MRKIYAVAVAAVCGCCLIDAWFMAAVFAIAGAGWVWLSRRGDGVLGWMEINGFKSL